MRRCSILFSVSIAVERFGYLAQGAPKRDLIERECQTDPIVQIRGSPSWLAEYWNFNHVVTRGFQNLAMVDENRRVSREDWLFTPALVNADFIFWGFERGPLLTMSLYNDETVLTSGPETDASVYHATRKLIDPTERGINSIQNTLVLDTARNNYVAFAGRHFNVYAHILLDHLGYLLYLKRTEPSNTRFVLVEYAGNPVQRTIVEELDSELAARIDWITCHDSDLSQCNTLVRFRGGNGTIRLMRPVSPNRYYNEVRDWINEVYPAKRNPEKVVIYYKRTISTAPNGRVMDPEQERDILRIIRNNLRRFNRSESLVLFNGSGYSIREQIDLFRSASIIIGPHGGGLANILFSHDFKTCEERPKLLEFATSPRSPKVQRGEMATSYHTMYATCPWVEFHNIFFTSESTANMVRIDFGELEDALQDMFDPSSPESKS